MRNHFHLFLLICLCSSSLKSQESAIFQSLTWARSIQAYGLGEQGVASTDPLSAMQFNPANLMYGSNVQCSYFKDPFGIWGYQMPLHSVQGVASIPGIGRFGVEYNYWNLGEYLFSTAADPYGEGIRFHLFERSVAFGYAASISDGTMIGLHVRRAWRSILNEKDLSATLISAGISAKPEWGNDRLTLGFSLMNFGTGAAYEYTNEFGLKETAKAPLPAQVNLGFEWLPISHQYAEIGVALSAMKPIVEYNSDSTRMEGISSFKALFTDWSDAPNDMTGYVGCSFRWKPVSLGLGVTLYEQMTVGYFNKGNEGWGDYSMFTHGASIGLAFGRTSVEIGYAGRWHNNDPESFIAFEFPRESFQLSMKTNMYDESTSEPAWEPEQIVLSVGTLFGRPLGKMKEVSLEGSRLGFRKNSLWAIEALFYMSEKSAILTSFEYSRWTLDADLLLIPNSIWRAALDFPFETFSLSSGIRYHPIDLLQPLFVQASLGVIRLNPVQKSSPRYWYQVADELAVGILLPIGSTGIVVTPKAALKTILMSEWSDGGELGGYNQTAFGVSVGYQF